MSEDNVKPHRWRRGQSGNPSGRPKLRLNEIARAHADAVDSKDPQKRRRVEVILDRLYASATHKTSASIRAAEEYLSRALGKPVTPIDVTGTVTHETAEQHVESIIQSLSMLNASDDDSVN